MDTILITGLTNNGTNIILIPNKTITTTKFGNGEYYYLRLACGMKGLAKATLPVLVQTTAANLPLLDTFGNTILPNQLYTRKNYKVGYGNKNATIYGSGQLVVQNALCVACTATTSSSTNAVTLTAKKVDK